MFCGWVGSEGSPLPSDLCPPGWLGLTNQNPFLFPWPPEPGTTSQASAYKMTLSLLRVQGIQKLCARKQEKDLYVHFRISRGHSFLKGVKERHIAAPLFRSLWSPLTPRKVNAREPCCTWLCTLRLHTADSHPEAGSRTMDLLWSPKLQNKDAKGTLSECASLVPAQLESLKPQAARWHRPGIPATREVQTGSP